MHFTLAKIILLQQFFRNQLYLLLLNTFDKKSKYLNKMHIMVYIQFFLLIFKHGK